VTSDPSGDERALLERYVDAVERRDFEAFAKLLQEDARLLMPPVTAWYQGRDAVVAFLKVFTDPALSEFGGDFRVVPTGANMQPALAFYVRRTGESEHRPMSLNVLKIEGGAIAEIASFPSEFFPAFGLPPSI
jgi:RNA polymerase sigma-70 factor (ECF subfamily)